MKNDSILHDRRDFLRVGVGGAGCSMGLGWASGGSATSLQAQDADRGKTGQAIARSDVHPDHLDVLLE